MVKKIRVSVFFLLMFRVLAKLFTAANTIVELHKINLCSREKKGTEIFLFVFHNLVPSVILFSLVPEVFQKRVVKDGKMRRQMTIRWLECSSSFFFLFFRMMERLRRGQKPKREKTGETKESKERERKREGVSDTRSKC